MRARVIRFLAVALAGAACQKAPSVESTTATLVFVSGLRGTVAPCGCQSRPLGGLDKLATLLDDLKKQGPTATVFVGDTFVGDRAASAALQAQEKQKARAIGNFLLKKRPLALLPGTADLDALQGALTDLHLEDRLPLFSPPRTLESRRRADSLIQHLGPFKIGILGVPGKAQGEALSYTAGALALRAQGADLVVALIPESGLQAREIAARIDGVDVALSGGGETLLEPRVINETLHLEAGDAGRYLGVLRAHRVPGSKGWVYDDEGKAVTKSLQERLARLREEAGRLQGEAKQVREHKIAQLQNELSALQTTTPPQNYLRFELLPIEQKISSAPWAAELLTDYNRSLCPLVEKATRDLSCQTAPENARYVGNTRCRACHGAAFAVWEKTKHAQAWATLKKAGKQCDLECIGCHTVGYEKAGGYCRLQDAEKNADVGCENCHGPGSGHAQTPADRSKWAADFSRTTTAAKCGECHNPQHSDQFHFERYLPQVLGPGHGQKLN